jgi:hypothetical protein
MKFILFFTASLSLWAHADQVDCSIAVADDSLMKIVYQVDDTGTATSKAQYQFFSNNGFVVQQFLNITKSEIPQDHGFIRLNAEGQGNTITFEANFRGGVINAYTGVAQGLLKAKPFQRLIVCGLIKAQK